MSKTEIQKQQLNELHKNIWNICCEFWGKMEPDDYKDYVLSLLFYRYLSEKVENVVASLLKEDGITYEEAWADSDYKEALTEDLLEITGYIIQPQYLFSTMYNMINVKKEGFDIEYLSNAINSLVDSTRGQSSWETFDGIFEAFDLKSSKLGQSVEAKTELIKKAMTGIGSINFTLDDSKIDVIGDAYEYLISQFAATAGKKSGSFYTPQAVGDLMGMITTYGRTDILNAMDPCGGSGSLLLTLKNYANVRNLYYQELTTTTYNLARMNMLLHGIPYHAMHMKNDDSLINPKFLDIEQDIIIANPPYSAKWSADEKFLSDERFSKYGVLAPKSKADYAFVLTMLHSLKQDGIMAVVLPHGVLFRGGTEGKIRKALIENNNIDTIIGLPGNCFYGTSIPTLIMVLKKNKKDNNILFIDASQDYEAGRNQNYIREDHIEKIFNAYKDRKDIDKYAHLATLNEIKENDYNLNIPRYVDTFEEEEEIDLKEVDLKIKQVDKEMKDIDKELESYLKDLGVLEDKREKKE